MLLLHLSSFLLLVFLPLFQPCFAYCLRLFDLSSASYHDSWRVALDPLPLLFLRSSFRCEIPKYQRFLSSFFCNPPWASFKQFSLAERRRASPSEKRREKSERSRPRICDANSLPSGSLDQGVPSIERHTTPLEGSPGCHKNEYLIACVSYSSKWNLELQKERRELIVEFCSRPVNLSLRFTSLSRNKQDVPELWIKQVSSSDGECSKKRFLVQ